MQNGGTNPRGHNKYKKKKWGEFGWIFLSIFSRKNDGSDHQEEIMKRVGNQPSSAIPPLSKPHSFMKLMQMENEEQKKPNKAYKLKPLKISRFFSKHGCSFKFIKFKTNKADTNSNTNNSQNSCPPVNGKQESKKNLSLGRVASIGRVPPRILSPRQRLKMAHSLTKMASRGKSSRQDECDEFLAMMGSGRKPECVEELCKKRILMGVKCKPLSGNLQYDKDGVLLPDITPSP